MSLQKNVFATDSPCNFGIGLPKKMVKERVMRDHTRTYFDGHWIRPSSGQILNVIDPASEQPADHNTLAQITPDTVTRA